MKLIPIAIIKTFSLFFKEFDREVFCSVVFLQAEISSQNYFPTLRAMSCLKQRSGDMAMTHVISAGRHFWGLHVTQVISAGIFLLCSQTL